MGILDYTHIYVGDVVDNKDDQFRGRLQVNIPNLTGGINKDDLPWAEPCFPYSADDKGMFFIPEIGSSVIVIYLNGSCYAPLWLGSTHKLTYNVVPSEAKTNYPEVKIIKTKVGYVLFDDKDEYISIKHKSGSYLKFCDNGDIIIHAAGKIRLNPANA
jgi:uncharacterized protein involved in type VI secretion and phage assembly